MSTKNKDKEQGGAPPQDGVPPIDPHVQDTAAREWELNLPKYKVPTPEGLITVTAEVLEKDPALLKYMVDTFPDCFKTLPAPAESTDITE